MDKTQTKNCPITNPGLEISAASSPLVKIGSATEVKVNGVFASISSENAPSLALATNLLPNANPTGMGGSPAIISNQLTYGGVAGNEVGSLAVGYSRIYTLCSDINSSNALYWLVGKDAISQIGESEIAHTPLPSSVEIGYVVITNGTSSAFVPGTTALDTASLTVTYLNNYAYVSA